MSIYSLDRSFRQRFQLSQLFPWTKAKSSEKIGFILTLKLNFQGNWNSRLKKVKLAIPVNI